MSVLTTESFAAWLADYSAVVTENAAYLTDLDREIGDADHGSNMERGMRAVAALSAADFATPSDLLKKAGMTLVSTVGGAAGPLYGTFFLRFAAGFAGPGSDGERFAAGLQAGLDGIVARGKASVGEKTMVDALTPAVAACAEAVADGFDLGPALAAAAEAAVVGRDSTIPLVATKGRASYLGERSAGHLDPGATSVTMLLESAARTLS